MNEQRNARITRCNDHFRWPALAFLLQLFLLVVPYSKQLNNLDCSVVTGKSQTSAYCIDLAIARAIRKASVWAFPVTTSLWVISSHYWVNIFLSQISWAIEVDLKKLKFPAKIRKMCAINYVLLKHKAFRNSSCLAETAWKLGQPPIKADR